MINNYINLIRIPKTKIIIYDVFKKEKVLIHNNDELFYADHTFYYIIGKLIMPKNK